MRNKILLIRLDRIGDVVLSTPVIKALRDAYPKSHIAFMVRPYCRDIVEGNPYLDEVIIYDKGGSHKGLPGNIRFIQELRRKRFDLAIVLHPTTRSHLVAALAGIPEIIGYDRKWGSLLTKKIPHMKHYGLKHERDYVIDVLKYVGIEAKDRSLYMPVKEDSEKRIDAVFGSAGLNKGDVIIVFNAGASCPSKRWSAERFAEAGNELVKRAGAKIVVIGGESDKEAGSKVASLIKGTCLDLSGKTTVADLASIFRRSNLLISNDSGPVHIACAVGAPVVAIFGRSDRGLSPLRWGPTGGRSVILHKATGCEVCLAHNCAKGFACLDAVTVDEVVDAALGLLK